MAYNNNGNNSRGGNRSGGSGRGGYRGDSAPHGSASYGGGRSGGSGRGGSGGSGRGGSGGQQKRAQNSSARAPWAPERKPHRNTDPFIEDDDRGYRGEKRRNPYAAQERTPRTRPEAAKPFAGKPVGAKPFAVKAVVVKPIAADEPPKENALAHAQREEGREDLVFGRNAVREALKSGRGIDKVLVARGEMDGAGRALVAGARERGLVVQEVERQRLDMLCRGPHQGIAAMVAVRPYVEVDTMLQTARDKGEEPLLVVLDGITDPQNLGSIIRSAECAGAHGVIISKRRAAGLTSAVARASAGAVEYLPVARVPNIPSLLEQLKKEGLWIAGAHMEGQPYDKAPLEGPIALVIGAEGEGLGRLVRERCDFLVSLPMKGQVSSLNASVAAGVMIYEALRRRG